MEFNLRQKIPAVFNSLCTSHSACHPSIFFICRILLALARMMLLPNHCWYYVLFVLYLQRRANFEIRQGASFLLTVLFFSLFLSHAWGGHLNDLTDKGAARYIDDTTSKQCDRTCFEQWDEKVGQTWLTKADVCKRGREPESKVDSHSSSVTLSLSSLLAFTHTLSLVIIFLIHPLLSFLCIPLWTSINSLIPTLVNQDDHGNQPSCHFYARPFDYVRKEA